MSICPCGGKIQSRISTEGQAFECVSCGRYEVRDKATFKGIIQAIEGLAKDQNKNDKEVMN